MTSGGFVIIVTNKIEGTLIQKLAIVQILQSKNSQKIHQKIRQKICQKIIQNIIHNKKQKQNETKRNKKKQKDQVTPKSMVPFSSYQSRFLEATPLLTAEDIWFQCDLYLRLIPPINLWKICNHLRPFSKYLHVPFLRPLRSPRSKNLENQNDGNS